MTQGISCVKQVKEGWWVWTNLKPQGLLDAFTNQWAVFNKAVQEHKQARENCWKSLQMHLMLSDFFTQYLLNFPLLHNSFWLSLGADFFRFTLKQFLIPRKKFLPYEWGNNFQGFFCQSINFQSMLQPESVLGCFPEWFSLRGCKWVSISYLTQDKHIPQQSCMGCTQLIPSGWIFNKPKLLKGTHGSSARLPHPMAS